MVMDTVMAMDTDTVTDDTAAMADTVIMAVTAVTPDMGRNIKIPGGERTSRDALSKSRRRYK